MSYRIAFLSLAACLTLAACDDPQNEQAQAPDAEASAPEETETAANEAADEDASGETVTITVPSADEVRDSVSQAADDVRRAGEELGDRVSQQIEEATDGRTLGEVAEDTASQVRSAAEETANQVSTAVDQQLARLDEAAEDAEADWRSTYSAEVPFYNMSEEPVPGYAEANGNESIVTIEPGSGGYIETCNDNLDWCEISLGDGTTAWVNMSAFGGVAN